MMEAAEDWYRCDAAGLLRSPCSDCGSDEIVSSDKGKSIREIARTLRVSRNTVRRYLGAEGLPRYEREARPSKLDPYNPILRSSRLSRCRERIAQPGRTPPCATPK